MEAKTFEIRDSATFIPVIAVRLEPSNRADAYLLARVGYERDMQGRYVLLTWIARGKTEHDPGVWGSRTLTTAHGHILEKWNELNSGDVVDVEFLLGLSTTIKKSERLEHPL